MRCDPVVVFGFSGDNNVLLVEMRICRSTDILRNKFSESETYDSEVWKLFAQYIFHYNGFFFKCCFNENGEFEIRTYKRMDNVEE